MPTDREVLRQLSSLEVRAIRELLFSEQKQEQLDQLYRLELLRFFCSDLSVIRTVATADRRREIGYALVDFEYQRVPFDPLRVEQTLNDAFRKSVESEDTILCDVLLQAGADLFTGWDSNPAAEPRPSIYDRIMETEHDGLHTLIDVYFPGVWSAVESENIGELRRLVNNWCSTDIWRDGLSLAELAMNTGHEPIIRLVNGVDKTMKLIRSIMAGNVPSVRTLLQQYPSDLHLDFRNMSEEGAPLLYYVIEREEVEITKMLVEAGCRIFTMMRLRNEPQTELPVFFAAILNPNLRPELLEALLPVDRPKQDELLYRLLFRGKNVLEVAVESNLNPKSFRILVERCGARVMADRNQDCRTVRDVASELHHSVYVQILDEYVENCVQHPLKYPHQRQILALFGYDFSVVPFQEVPADNFLTVVYEYQAQIKQLGKCIEDDDTALFEALSVWRAPNLSDSGLFESLLCWEGRGSAENPLPMLHRAVLFNRADIVRYILRKKPRGHSIDTLFDHHRRTALHYGYSLKEFNEIRLILRESGCSDHSLDRDGKEPLDFKERMSKVNMRKLIERLRFADFSIPEPPAWENATDDSEESGDSGEESGDEDDGPGCVLM